MMKTLELYYPMIQFLIISDIPLWGIFGLVTCLDQSRASENIWWIIKAGGDRLIDFLRELLDELSSSQRFASRLQC